ncbi:MAG: NAD-dependent epimerase/dehydratase family protein [Actinomycetota bacterium]|nr:NAD-dependent epimerase/dehydratase family protein [Actinomycetota bacterium]
MRILVIGGTRFIGSHLVDSLLASGNEVTLLHRGLTNPGAFPDAEHRIGDRNGDLAVLAQGRWEATVDFSAYLPIQVRTLATALDGRGGHYVYISSVSAYANPTVPGVREDAALARLDDPDNTPLSDEAYGGLKARCEEVAREAFGDSGPLTIVRPTYVAGPRDHTARFTWWVERVARGGRILAPGPAGNPFQIIDARDLAAFLARITHDRTEGVFNAAGPASPITFGDVLATMAETLAPAGTGFHWVEATPLLEAGVRPGVDFPLWEAEDESRLILTADSSRAIAAGLSLRPLAETIADTHAFEGDAHTVQKAGIGISPERELELLGLLA